MDAASALERCKTGKVSFGATLGLLLGLCSAWGFAEEQAAPKQSGGIQTGDSLFKAFETLRQQELERLKRENPQAYEQRKAALEREQKMQAVVTAFYQGTLSGDEAERRLTPLVKKQLEEEGALSSLSARIERLEDKLAFLKKAQKNPNLLVKQRIEQMLGKTTATTVLPADFGLTD